MESIAELIAHPEQLNKDTLHGLRELVAKYPYYQAARLLFLKNLFHNFCKLRRRAVKKNAYTVNSCRKNADADGRAD